MKNKPLITNARIKQLLKQSAKDMFKDKFNPKEWTFSEVNWDDGDIEIKYFHTENLKKKGFFHRHKIYYQLSKKFIQYELSRFKAPEIIAEKRLMRIVR